MSDEPDTFDLTQMTLDDHESLLRLCVELRDVIRADELLSPDERLMVIERAMQTAIGGSPEEARDLVRDVLLGRLCP
jgi:hypothetical protein